MALHCISAFSRGPFQEFLSFLYKTFLRYLLIYALPGWFPFLSVTNSTNFKRLDQVVDCAITSCLSFSLIPLFLSGASLASLSGASLASLSVTLTHFALSSYERALWLPTFGSISGLAKIGVKPRLCRSPWRAFASNHPLWFFLLLLRRFSLLALPLLL